MAVPDDHLSGAGCNGALHRGIHFAGENAPRFEVSPLPRQQLFVGIVDTAGAFQIGHDQNASALRKTDGTEPKNAAQDPRHSTSCSLRSHAIEENHSRIRRIMRIRAGLLVILSLLAGCSKKDPEDRAMTPQDSLRAMRFSENFHSELFAAEP